MKNNKPFYALIASIILFFCFPKQVFPLNFNDSEDPKILASELVKNMSDEDALAQTFMLGWAGTSPSPLILSWIRERRLGGVKVFGWNTENTVQLAQTIGIFQAEALKNPAQIPLFVATDQEGGWVRHVKGTTSQTPGNMALGASRNLMDAYYSGYYIAKELALLGINMNFAPTVDLYTNRNSVLIGPRSFGVDPIQAGMLGTAFMRGQRENGIVSVAKHFPGHGDTAQDSHGVLPQINANFETLWDRELIPYRIMIKEGTPAIMSAHVAFPNTPAARTPASLSHYFLTNILREKMEFKGVIVTDDLMMNGAAISSGSLSNSAKQALMAGNDILMFSITPQFYDAVWTRLITAMKEERDFNRQVRESAERIVLLKLKYLRSENTVPFIPDLEKVKTDIPDAAGNEFFTDMAARSITIVKGDSKTIPLFPQEAGRVLLTGQYDDFFTIGKSAYPQAFIYRYYNSRPNDLIAQVRNIDTVIFCLAKNDDLNVLNMLQGLRKKVIVFSILTPIHLDRVPWVDGAIAAYSYATSSFIAGFSVLLGRIPSEGILPFSLYEPRWTAP